MSSTPECISAGDETQQNGANRKKPHARTHFPWSRVRFKSSRLRHAGQLKTGARSSTDRASDYGSEGWGFESLRARTAQRPFPSLWRRLCWSFDDSFDDSSDTTGEVESL